MSPERGVDLEGRVLEVAPAHRAANPRRPNTHGWLAFEVLRRAPDQRLSASDYERRLFQPSPEIAALAVQVPGVQNAYQDLKHIRCDISRGHVLVTPPLPAAWFEVSRCAEEQDEKTRRHDADVSADEDRVGKDRSASDIEIKKKGVRIKGLDDWKLHAGPKAPDQWRPGRSAYECASAWCGTGALAMPAEIRALLDSHPDTRDCVIEYGIPEHQVRFDRIRGEPRNADLVLLARGRDGRLAISIEAKADEPFGEYVGDVVADAIDRIAHGERTGLLRRVEGLAATFLPARPPRGEKLGNVRYQLLTAAAGAIAFAKEHEASRAVLIVHVFHTVSTDEELHRMNTADLDVFVRRLSGGSVSRLRDGMLEGPIFTPVTETSEQRPALYLGKASRRVP